MWLKFEAILVFIYFSEISSILVVTKKNFVDNYYNRYIYIYIKYHMTLA